MCITKTHPLKGHAWFSTGVAIWTVGNAFRKPSFPLSLASSTMCGASTIFCMNSAHGTMNRVELDGPLGIRIFFFFYKPLLKWDCILSAHSPERFGVQSIWQKVWRWQEGGDNKYEWMSLSCQSESEFLTGCVRGWVVDADLQRWCVSLAWGEKKGVTQALGNKNLFLGREVLTVCQSSSS